MNAAIRVAGAAALLLSILPFDAARAEPEPLPDGVAAIVGEDVIRMDELREALVHRFQHADEGRQVLDNLVSDLLVADEAARRRVSVTEADLDAYLKKVADQVKAASGGKQTLAEFLASQDVTMAEFRRDTKGWLLRQRLASADLGVRGEVSPADLAVWTEGLRRKAKVELPPAELPEGVFARFGDRSIGRVEFGEALLERLPDGRIESALWDLVVGRAVAHRLKAEGTTVEPSDLDQAVKELETEFADNPRVKGTTLSFSEYIRQVRQMSIEELKQDPVFVAQVGLSKSIRLKLSRDDARAYYEEHAGIYGERRSFVHLLIRGEEEDAVFRKHIRTMRQAKELAERHLAAVRAGESFEALVKEHSENRSEDVDPNDPITVTRESAIPDELKAAIFGADPGTVVGPVRSTYGYHLVKVHDVTPAPSFEEAYPIVLRDLVRELRSKAILNIRADPSVRLRY